MLTHNSLKIDQQQLLRGLAKLETRYGLDLFAYSKRGYTTSPDLIVGIATTHELVVTQETPREALARFAFQDNQPTLGFLSYDYGLAFNRVTSRKKRDFPWGHLKKYKAYLIYNDAKQTFEIKANDPLFAQELEALIYAPHEALSCSIFPQCPSIQSSLSKEAYIQGVERVLKYIQAGDTYQLNLSIAFQAHAKISSLFALFSELLHKYPAAHYGFFKSGNYTILSTSPETFLNVKDGAVLSSPIKGTRTVQPGIPIEEQARKLRENPKEEAELSMIVDLIRNDISKHCEYGSVKVQDHLHIFQVDQLLQMCTHVCGQLRSKATVLDLLLDAFPGGSITGFPKERSMQIIESLEPHARSIYCGTLFTLWNEKNIDASIAIRTAYYDHQTSHFRWFAGSGITMLSDPLPEYEETIAKSSKFWRLFRPATE